MTNPTRSELWEQRTEWPLALVAVFFLVVQSVQVITRPHGEEAHILWLAGWLAWSLFVVDYFVRLILASNRRRWFFQHLFDLLIVALPMVRPLRLLRLVVLVGVLQRAIGNAVRGRILIFTISGVVLLIYVASLAILQAERDQPDAKITSFGKAVWWAINEVTTIGSRAAASALNQLGNRGHDDQQQHGDPDGVHLATRADSRRQWALPERPLASQGDQVATCGHRYRQYARD